jgi:Striatin family
MNASFALTKANDFFLFQARIAFLQGERKGQENVKSDLVRRIKMLEYALKQERYVLTYILNVYNCNSIIWCKEPASYYMFIKLK